MKKGAEIEIREIEIGGSYDVTVLEPATAIITVVLIALTFVLPRKRAVLPFMLICCLFPLSQRVVIGGLDFSMIRLIVIFGWLRILARGEYKSFRWNALDKAFLSWNVIGTIVYFLQKLSVGALVYKAGESIDVVGAYFLVRLLINDPRHLIQIFKDFAWIAGSVGVLMFHEFKYGDNWFHVFGSREHVYVSPNTLRVRAMGPFSHVIMGGSFHASIVPLCIGLYLGTRRHLPLVLYGVVGCTLGVFGANSSGALAAWLGGLGGMSMWVARRYINTIWKFVFVLLFVLHLVMEKPVWHLLVRAAELTGGGGYHRYLLIDACVHRLPEWALLGTKSTAHWGWGLQDVTNQWVLEAVNGGLATLVAFNCVLFFAFKLIGDAHKNMRRNPSVGRRMRNQSMAVGWALGASLLAHCFAFLSVSYFGQLKAVFAMSIAMIAAHYETTRRSRPGSRSSTPAKKKAAARKKTVEKNGGRAPAGSRRGPGSTGTNDAPAPSLGAALVGPTARHQAPGTAAPPGRRAEPGDGGKSGG